MDYNQIDVQPLFPGWGVCFQGGAVDDTIYKLPAPLVIVNLNRGEVNSNWIRDSVKGTLSLWIDDNPTACLPDEELLAFVKAGIALLENGMNLYIHCGAGVSRSSYYDIALHMIALKKDYDQAFQYIKERRDVAAPNPGFEAQLRRIGASLSYGQ